MTKGKREGKSEDKSEDKRREKAEAIDESIERMSGRVREGARPSLDAIFHISSCGNFSAE